MKKTSNKTILFLGLLFILIAFGCVIGVFYQIFNAHQQKAQEMQAIEEKMADVGEQKETAERKIQELAKRVGREIELNRLIAAAEQEYGEEERQRKEGDLWVDGEGEDWMITLGFLHGIEKGSRLRIIGERGRQIGVVVVESVLDVVSYVYPLEDRGQYKDDVYRVIVE